MLRYTYIVCLVCPRTGVSFWLLQGGTKQKAGIDGNKLENVRKTENDRVQNEKWCKLAKGVIVKLL
jgi:hypothetical protein